MIPRRNYHGYTHSVSCKYINSSRIPAALSEKGSKGIGLHENADKTEYLCFSQKRYISILNGGSLKLEDKFTCLGGRVSSNESDINIRLEKA